ncbi:hypothetical protein CRE_00325 [Caenorhabditis remanei]|uniref:Uncharacterized protein n=1 Tax=Caenorhabditis remanei TaxID=31234 RepID=E3LEI5_CAERE|nr:hypothetical protein CRE_00325 [Caenorhabditis remanei]
MLSKTTLLLLLLLVLIPMSSGETKLRGILLVYEHQNSELNAAMIVILLVFVLILVALFIRFEKTICRRHHCVIGRFDIVGDSAELINYHQVNGDPYNINETSV